MDSQFDVEYVVFLKYYWTLCGHKPKMKNKNVDDLDLYIWSHRPLKLDFFFNDKKEILIFSWIVSNPG